MSIKKLIIGENLTCKIIEDDGTINFDDFLHIDVLKDEFYVMGTYLHDPELILTTCVKYYTELTEYMKHYNRNSDEDEEIEVVTTMKIHNSDEYIIEETIHFLDYDLETFHLYKITKKNMLK